MNGKKAAKSATHWLRPRIANTRAACAHLWSGDPKIIPGSSRSATSFSARARNPPSSMPHAITSPSSAGSRFVISASALARNPTRSELRAALSASPSAQRRPSGGRRSATSAMIRARDPGSPIPRATLNASPRTCSSSSVGSRRAISASAVAPPLHHQCCERPPAPRLSAAPARSSPALGRAPRHH